MNVVANFKKYMIEHHSTNMGPDYSKTNDPEDDIYRALAVLIADTCRHDIGLDEIPKKPFCKLVMCNSNPYFQQILKNDIVLREFDRIYEFMVDTWNGNFDDIKLKELDE